MKRVFQTITAGLMMAILFAVTSGFTLFSHICLMGGDKQVSAQEIMGCCSVEQPVEAASNYEASCCEHETTFIKLEFTSTVVKYQGADHSILATGLLLPDFTIEPAINDLPLQHNNLPPPKTGREILTEKQVYRI